MCAHKNPVLQRSGTTCIHIDRAPTSSPSASPRRGGGCLGTANVGLVSVNFGLTSLVWGWFRPNLVRFHQFRPIFDRVRPQCAWSQPRLDLWWGSFRPVCAWFRRTSSVSTISGLVSGRSMPISTRSGPDSANFWCVLSICGGPGVVQCWDPGSSVVRVRQRIAR